MLLFKKVLTVFIFFLLFCNKSYGTPRKLSIELKNSLTNEKTKKKLIKKRIDNRLRLKNLCFKYNIKSIYCHRYTMKIPPFIKVKRIIASYHNRKYGKIDILRKSLKHSALLPSISLEYGRWDAIDRSYSTKPGEENWFDEANGLRQVFRIRLSWEFPRLLFDPNDIIIVREKRKNLVFFETKLALGRRLFYKWKKEMFELLRWPSLRRILSLEELETTLNNLTGNRFSRLIIGI